MMIEQLSRHQREKIGRFGPWIVPFGTALLSGTVETNRGM